MLQYFLVCVGEGEYVGGKSQQTISTMLSSVKEENLYKVKEKKAAIMSRSAIVCCLFSAAKAFFYYAFLILPSERDRASKYQ